MEKHYNDNILVVENCVVECLKLNSKEHDMNTCIQRCIIHERICKALKVCMKYNCDKETYICLMYSCLNSGLNVIEECLKHKMKHCQDCVKIVNKLVQVLNKKCQKQKCSCKKQLKLTKKKK